MGGTKGPKRRMEKVGNVDKGGGNGRRSGRAYRRQNSGTSRTMMV